jgi:2-haloacid dehalogenase
MIALHARLRSAGAPLFIFSNTNGFAVRHIRENYPFFGGFDDYIFSYEHGAMKPEAALYEVVEVKTGRRGGGLLYVDDRPENIETARQRGWQAVLHSSADETARAMRAAGLLP